MEKRRQNIPEEDKQKKKEYMKEYRKNQSKNLLKKRKTKQNKKLKSIEVNKVTNFIKDEVERFSDAEVCGEHDSEEDDIFEIWIKYIWLITK